MRILLLIPAALTLTAAGGFGLCTVAHLQPHAAEMIAALCVVSLACAAGVAPVVFQRHATQLVMSQAALVGMVVHLLVALGAAALLGKLNPHSAFLYWLMAFYWVSLATLAAVLVRFVRRAPAAAPTTHPRMHSTP